MKTLNTLLARAGQVLRLSCRWMPWTHVVNACRTAPARPRRKGTSYYARRRSHRPPPVRFSDLYAADPK